MSTCVDCGTELPYQLMTRCPTCRDQAELAALGWRPPKPNP
jgi:hypothetical protein